MTHAEWNINTADTRILSTQETMKHYQQGSVEYTYISAN